MTARDHTVGKMVEVREPWIKSHSPPSQYQNKKKKKSYDNPTKNARNDFEIKGFSVFR